MYHYNHLEGFYTWCFDGSEVNNLAYQELKRMRKSSGLTVYDMGAKLGISGAHYNNLENGKRGLTYKMAVDIASLFAKTPDELFLTSFRSLSQHVV